MSLAKYNTQDYKSSAQNENMSISEVTAGKFCETSIC